MSSTPPTEAGPGHPPGDRGRRAGLSRAELADPRGRHHRPDRAAGRREPPDLGAAWAYGVGLLYALLLLRRRARPRGRRTRSPPGRSGFPCTGSSPTCRAGTRPSTSPERGRVPAPWSPPPGPPPTGSSAGSAISPPPGWRVGFRADSFMPSGSSTVRPRAVPASCPVSRWTAARSSRRSSGAPPALGPVAAQPPAMPGSPSRSASCGGSSAGPSWLGSGCSSAYSGWGCSSPSSSGRARARAVGWGRAARAIEGRGSSRSLSPVVAVPADATVADLPTGLPPVVVDPTGRPVALVDAAALARGPGDALRHTSIGSIAVPQPAAWVVDTDPNGPLDRAPRGVRRRPVGHRRRRAPGPATRRCHRGARQRGVVRPLSCGRGLRPGPRCAPRVGRDSSRRPCRTPTSGDPGRCRHSDRVARLCGARVQAVHDEPGHRLLAGVRPRTRRAMARSSWGSLATIVTTTCPSGAAAGPRSRSADAVNHWPSRR